MTVLVDETSQIHKVIRGPWKTLVTLNDDRSKIQVADALHGLSPNLYQPGTLVKLWEVIPPPPMRQFTKTV